MEQAFFDRLLVINLILSTVIFYWAANIYILPKLKTIPAATLFIPILILHALRHLGMMFLTAGAVYEGMPPAFAYPAGYGDLLASVLAMFALFTVTKNKLFQWTVVLIFNIVGTLDLINAIALGARYNIGPFMGASYWIPSFWVPMLLVTHYIVFKKLWLEKSK